MNYDLSLEHTFQRVYIYTNGTFICSKSILIYCIVVVFLLNLILSCLPIPLERLFILRSCHTPRFTFSPARDASKSDIVVHELKGLRSAAFAFIFTTARTQRTSDMSTPLKIILGVWKWKQVIAAQKGRILINWRHPPVEWIEELSISRACNRARLSCRACTLAARYRRHGGDSVYIRVREKGRI